MVRVLDVARTVEALGWQGAVEALDDEWVGWEADVLVLGVSYCLEAWKAQRERDERRWWSQALGGGRR